MTISVVIPTMGTQNMSGLMDDILRQECSQKFEIFVVFNPANTANRKLMREWATTDPRIRYLESVNAGANIARNVGISASSGEVVLFLDDDCRIDDPKFFENHWNAHLAHSDISAMGGAYILSIGGTPLQRAYHQIQMSWLASGITAERRCFYLLGGNCSFKAEVLAKNRFEEKLKYGGTETELFIRLGNEGHRFLFLKDVSVRHDSALKLCSFLRKAFLQGIGSAFLARQGLNLRYVGRGAPVVEAEADHQLFDRCYRFAFLSGREWSLNTGQIQITQPRLIVLLLRNFFAAPWGGLGRVIEDGIIFLNALLSLAQLTKTKSALEADHHKPTK